MVHVYFALIIYVTILRIKINTLDSVSSKFSFLLLTNHEFGINGCQ